MMAGPDLARRPPTPVEVRRLAAERLLRVTWSDGHVSDLPFAYLRGWCPCAGCQGHGGEKRYVHAADTDLADIAVVGKYALQLRWGDGHETGIYSYRYLRELCACAECAREPVNR
jgi:DUF971 family protein